MKNKNLILIIADSATPSRIPLTGPRADICPTIINLANSGLWCENFYSHGNPTEFSMASIFSSSLPLDRGGYMQGMSTRKASLLNYLKTHGYSTCLLTKTYILDSLYGFDAGADFTLSFYDIELIWRCMRRTFLWHILRKKEQIGHVAVQREIIKVVSWFYDFILDYTQRWINLPEFVGNLNTPIFCYDFQTIHNLVLEHRDHLNTDPQAYIERNIDRITNNSLEGFLKIQPIYRHLNKLLRPLDHKRIPGTDLRMRTYDKQISSAAAFDIIFKWINTLNGAHFAAVVHLMDIHDNICSEHQYVMRPTQSYQSRQGLGACNREQYTYDMALNYVDTNLNNFLKSLPNHIVKDTVVAITSDHGAVRFKGQHALSSTSVTGCFHDKYLHIPFLLNGPGVPIERHQTLASSIDVAPTICEALDLPIDPGFCGKSLLSNTQKTDFVVAEHTHRGPCDPLEGPIYQCFRNDRYKYIIKERISEHDASPPATEILIDLQQSPDETKNIAGDLKNKDVLHSFREIAKNRRAEIKSQAKLLANVNNSPV